MEPIKTGDILYFRTKFRWYKPSTWLGPIIRFFTKIQYNHVGVIVVVAESTFVVEAVGRGVIITPFDVRTEGKKIMVKRSTIDATVGFAKEALSFCGHTPYDVMGLVVHQLAWVTMGIWIGPRNEEDAIKRFYCFEFAAYMHRGTYPDWATVNVKEFINASWQKLIYKN